MNNIRRIIISVIAIVLVLSVGLTLASCEKPDAPTTVDNIKQATYIDAELVKDIPSSIEAELAKHDNDIDKGIALLSYAVYNTAGLARFRFDCVMTSVSKAYTMRSAYTKLRVGGDYFQDVRGFSSKMPFVNVCHLRARYQGYRVVVDGNTTGYNEDTNTVDARWSKSINKDKSYPQESTPLTMDNTLLYSAFESPLNLENRAQYADCIITKEEDVDGNGYYKLLIETDVEALNSDEYTHEMLMKSISDSQEATYNSYTLEFTIWDVGVFRSATIREDYSAKAQMLLPNMDVSAESIRQYVFSYDALGCNVAKCMADVDMGKFLPAEQKALFDAELASLYAE